jgi:hypothetical protein
MRLRESSIYIYIEEFIYSSKIRDLEESGGKRNYENPKESGGEDSERWRIKRVEIGG